MTGAGYASGNLRFRLGEQSNFDLGRERDTNGPVIPGIFSSGSTVVLKKYRQFDDLGKLVAVRSSRSKIKKSSGRFVMPSRNESERARARLQLEAPISDDANLLNLQRQVEDFVREAKCRDGSEPNELVSRGIRALARDCFRIRKQRQHARDIQMRRVATRNP
jgi:hypothetical protein